MFEMKDMSRCLAKVAYIYVYTVALYISTGLKWALVAIGADFKRLDAVLQEVEGAC